MSIVNSSDLFPEPCLEDFDCNGTQLCYDAFSGGSNVNYSACFCNAYYGWMNQTSACSGRSPTFVILVFSISAQFSCAAALTLVAGLDMFRILFEARHKLRHVKTTLLSVVMLPFSAGLFVIWKFLSLMSTFSSKINSVEILPDGTEVKAGAKELVMRPYIVACLLFAGICCGSLALTWISIAERVRLFRMTRVSSWREVVFGAFVLFFILVGIVALTVDWDTAWHVTLPFILLIVLLLRTGRLRMVKLLRASISMDRDQHFENPEERNKAGHKEQRALLAISRSGNNINFGLAGILVCGSISFFFDVTSSARSFDSIGGISYSSLLVELTSWFVFYSIAAMFWYIHRNVNKLLKTSMLTPATLNPGEEDPYENRQSINPVAAMSMMYGGGR
eukprot:CAMPEP_0184507618 /NCGR_PEP_ID=MMETSP0198_2-20121128/332_1 /TAXON_ID=1112570 /ORGANISM="Thraustochytrium sp., Strain LLF1b" /LENGTH=391 /DNA_ID=CAMNT_0026897365 /DNA_START=226 /DNA_END=1401 /DNA_ORIENTATION=-